MLISYNRSDDHKMKGHFERPERVTETVKYLKTIYSKDLFLEPKYTNELYPDVHDILTLVYSKNYIESLVSTELDKCNKCFSKFTNGYCSPCKKDLGENDKITHFGSHDNYWTWKTFQIICESIYVLKQTVDEMIEKNIPYGYALIRPPGHHSCRDSASGFCYFNNVILMAKYLQSEGYKSICILDYDYHIGDGTNKLIEENENIYLASIHAANAFPYNFKYSDSINDKCMNIDVLPIDDTNTDNMDTNDSNKEINKHCLNVITGQIVPFFKSVNPDFIIVSNGLDSHILDPLTRGFNVDNKFYIEVAKILKEFDVPLLYVLEGGYNVEVIKTVSHDIIRTLLN